MNYNVISHNYKNTGGYHMVSVFDVWLPDENRTVFVNVGEGYCTITTVNYIMSGLEIDDFDKITVTTLDYTEYDDCAVTNKYFKLCRYCLFEYLKKDCKYMNYTESLPFVWLLPIYQQQISAVERQFVKDEHGGCFYTDGYHVTVPTKDGERKVTEAIPQHKSLQQTLAACLHRLQSMYECNNEVMEVDDLNEVMDAEDLLTTIEDVKYYMAIES